MFRIQHRIIFSSEAGAIISYSLPLPLPLPLETIASIASAYAYASLFIFQMAFYIPPPIDVLDDGDLLDVIEDTASTSTADYNSKRRTTGFVHTTVPSFTDHEFTMHFRVTRTSFEILMQRLRHDFIHGGDHVKKMLLVLRFLGTQETLEAMSMSFDVSISSAWNIIREMLEVLRSSGFVSEMIHLPTNLNDIGRNFQSKSDMKFPPVFIGAIDCKEVEIQKPVTDPEAYYNRNHYHSIKLQATVDHAGKYWDVFIGWPGRTNDSRVFRNSPLHQKLRSGEFGSGYMLLGDSAYPMSSFVCTPFKHTRELTTQEHHFNREFSKLRQIVECAFGRTAERWRRLKFVYMREVKDICNIVHVICALHNFCSNQNNEVHFGASSSDMETDSDGDTNSSDAGSSSIDAEVNEVFNSRNDIFQYFLNR